MKYYHGHILMSRFLSVFRLLRFKSQFSSRAALIFANISLLSSESNFIHTFSFLALLNFHDHVDFNPLNKTIRFPRLVETFRVTFSEICPSVGRTGADLYVNEELQ